MRPLSARNPHVVRLDRLVRQRRVRVSEGAFVVDGPMLGSDALDAGITCTQVFLDADRRGDDADRVAARAAASGADVYELDGSTFGRVTDPVTPQGIAMVVVRPHHDATVLQGATLVVVLAEVQDPGNVGTLVRTAAAVGADAVIATTGTADVFAPKTVRSSAGAVLRMPILDQMAIDALPGSLSSAGIAGIASDVAAGTPHDELDLTMPVAIILGNEAHGVPGALRVSADRLAHIVMPGTTESLNVAMAGTVLCFEVLRQRRAQQGTGLDAVTPLTEGSPRHDR